MMSLLPIGQLTCLAGGGMGGGGATRSSLGDE